MHWALVALIVVAGAILLLGVGLWIYRETVSLYSPPSVRDNVYRMMNRFHQMAEHENLRYAVTCGTLLGAMRHKSVIPVDDDVDVVMSLDDANRMLQVCKQYGFLSSGLQMVAQGNNVHLDVFVVQPNEQGRWDYVDENARTRWPNEYYLPDELWPPQKVTFGPLSVWGPSQPLPYLHRAYPKWDREMRITSVHHGGILRHLKLNRVERPKQWKSFPPSKDCVECTPEFRIIK